ncbi:hypothetical protein Q4595_17225, partial [Wenyingzhuangia sp. 1_MG-2023]|nr:hypothetical protein [Wenyingzhuangia sp. 1_MG-2023]
WGFITVGQTLNRFEPRSHATESPAAIQGIQRLVQALSSHPGPNVNGAHGVHYFRIQFIEHNLFPSLCLTRRPGK